MNTDKLKIGDIINIEHSISCATVWSKCIIEYIFGQEIFVKILCPMDKNTKDVIGSFPTNMVMRFRNFEELSRVIISDIKEIPIEKDDKFYPYLCPKCHCKHRIANEYVGRTTIESKYCPKCEQSFTKIKPEFPNIRFEKEPGLFFWIHRNIFVKKDISDLWKDRFHEVWKAFIKLEEKIKENKMEMRINTDNLYRLLSDLFITINKKEE